MWSAVMTGSFMAAKPVKANAALCLTPPLDDIGLLEFKKMPKIHEIGYKYTKQQLEQLGDKNPFFDLQNQEEP